MNFPELNKFDVIAVDTETTGLNWSGGDRPFGFSISTPDGKDYYYDIRNDPRSLEALRQELKSYRGTVVAHNLSFDYHMFRNVDVELPLERCDDTVIRECLIDEHRFSYSLDELSKAHLGRSKFDIVPKLAEMFGGRATRNVQMPNLPRAPEGLVGTYAKVDTRNTLDLWFWQLDEIARQDRMGPRPLSLIVDFERSLSPLLIRSEQRGIRVDVGAAEQAQAAVTEQITPLQRRLDELCGFSVNVNSNRGANNHMSRIFDPRYRDGAWVTSGGEPLLTTKSGNPSLGKDSLQELSDPRAELIITLRGLYRLRDTFLGQHIIGHAVNGRVHPSIHQNKDEDGGAGTGRIQYSDPAMQQIPARDKMKAEVMRSIFLPEEGHSWVDCDKKSFEVRVFAHLVGGDALLNRFRQDPNTDLHSYVAELMGIPRDPPQNGGANGKQLNLSMIFNQGMGATAEKVGLPWEWDTFEADDGSTIRYKKAGDEAKRLIEGYHRAVPGVRKLATGCKRVAEERGYICTKYGRRLRFPKGYRSYKASGLLIQATAADFNKENWKLIMGALSDGAYLALNIHDGYGLSIPIGDERRQLLRVKEAIEYNDRSRIPLLLDINEPGRNWWESYSSPANLWLDDREDRSVRRAS